jgi:tetratricopeptide (TPR) repeat protein
MDSPGSQSPRPGASEFAFQLLLAGGLIGVLYGLEITRPVIYTRVVTEDNWGENATFLALVAAAALFAFLAWRTAQTARPLERLAWLGVGLGSGVLAGEEMSWGQRILGIPTPEALRKINLQQEMTLHNIDGISQLDLHAILVALLLGWAAVSWLSPKSIRERLKGFGLPLAPLHLAPLLLLVPWMLVMLPFAQSGEVAELLLGAFLAVWALDQVLRRGPFPQTSALGRATATGLIVVGIASAATVMSSFYPDQGMRHRLNLMALRDLPKMRLYSQADQVIAHIYAHPDRFMNSDTRLEHGKLLLSLDRTDEARQALTPILEETLPADADPRVQVDLHRQRGTVFALLGETALAQPEIQRAIGLDESLMANAAHPDERASHLLSISRSLAALDRDEEALARVREASRGVESASLLRELRKWQETLETRLARP